MGTRVAVELWSEDAALAERAMDAVIAEMRRTDELMSTYKPGSQLSQVNAHATSGGRGGRRHHHGGRARPRDVAPQRGAFDITYASVGYLYDYRAHQRRPTRDRRGPAGRRLPAGGGGP